MKFCSVLRWLNKYEFAKKTSYIQLVYKFGPPKSNFTNQNIIQTKTTSSIRMRLHYVSNLCPKIAERPAHILSELCSPHPLLLFQADCLSVLKHPLLHLFVHQNPAQHCPLQGNPISLQNQKSHCPSPRHLHHFQ